MFHIDGRLAILATACQASTPHKTLRQERTAPGPPGAARGLLGTRRTCFRFVLLELRSKGLRLFSHCLPPQFSRIARISRFEIFVFFAFSAVTLTQGGAVRRQTRNRL